MDAMKAFPLQGFRHPRENGQVCDLMSEFHVLREYPAGIGALVVDIERLAEIINISAMAIVETDIARRGKRTGHFRNAIIIGAVFVEDYVQKRIRCRSKEIREIMFYGTLEFLL